MHDRATQSHGARSPVDTGTRTVTMNTTGVCTRPTDTPLSTSSTDLFVSRRTSTSACPFLWFNRGPLVTSANAPGHVVVLWLLLKMGSLGLLADALHAIHASLQCHALWFAHCLGGFGQCLKRVALQWFRRTTNMGRVACGCETSSSSRARRIR